MTIRASSGAPSRADDMAHATMQARTGQRPAGGRPLQAMLTGLALTVGLGAQSFAATPSLEGRWTMAPAQSSFEETVTGPAPDAAVVTVTRDDARHLAYRLVESRAGAEVARGAYDIAFGGDGSTSSVDGERLQVAAERGADGDVVIRAPQVGKDQAVIRMRRTGPDTAILEHDVVSGGAVRRLETITLIRSQQTAAADVY
jgi:hypothetical protein